MNQNLQGGQVVKKVGSYLYRHLDSAYNYKNSANSYDVYIYVYHKNDKIDLDINITTYADKIRINITEISPEEKTIGQIILSYKRDLNDFLQLTYNKIITKLDKYYN